MKVLIIGDLHFRDDLAVGYMDAQTETILGIWENEKPECVVFLGDIFHYRKPNPKVLLRIKSMLQTISLHSEVHVVVGNHDQATKADDGITALSLFEDKKIRVWNSPGADNELGFYFIPCFENEKTIIKCLEGVPDAFTLFGHFAFSGSLNSVGSYDFSIPLSCARNSGFLGHIHKYSVESIGGGDLSVPEKSLIFLGTPYPTLFSESGQKHHYAILEGEPFNWETSIKTIDFGIRYIDIPFSKIKKFEKKIFDPKYFTLLRIHMQAHENSMDDKIAEKLREIPHVEYVYDPLINEDDLSNFDADRQIDLIDESLIDDYVKGQSSDIDTDILLKGLELLKKNEY